jgi:hypothetical protein
MKMYELPMLLPTVLSMTPTYVCTRAESSPRASSETRSTGQRRSYQTRYRSRKWKDRRVDMSEYPPQISYELFSRT